MSKTLLNKNAVKVISNIQKEVNEVSNFVAHYGIHYHSDAWISTDWECNVPYNATCTLPHHNEDILNWNTEDFKSIDITNITKFYIGGGISSCTYEYEYREQKEPKALAQAKSNWVKQLLQNIITTYENNKYFHIRIYDSGLESNCGWEHFICIEATIKDNAKRNSSTMELVNQIMEESDAIIETSASPLFSNPNNMFNNDLQPKGDFAYMIEFFSWDLINHEEYEGVYGGVTSEYVKKAYNFIHKVEHRADCLRNKYEDKGVKVTVNGLNDGCQYGMAIYVWIPSQ